MFQLKLLIAIIVMAGGAGGYLYVQKLQSDLKLSEANNAKLEGGIQDQQAVIKQLKEDFAQIQNINKQLEETYKRDFFLLIIIFFGKFFRETNLFLLIHVSLKDLRFPHIPISFERIILLKDAKFCGNKIFLL